MAFKQKRIPPVILLLALCLFIVVENIVPEIRNSCSSRSPLAFSVNIIRTFWLVVFCLKFNPDCLKPLATHLISSLLTVGFDMYTWIFSEFSVLYISYE